MDQLVADWETKSYRFKMVFFSSTSVTFSYTTGTVQAAGTYLKQGRPFGQSHVAVENAQMKMLYRYLLQWKLILLWGEHFRHSVMKDLPLNILIYKKLNRLMKQSQLQTSRLVLTRKSEVDNMPCCFYFKFVPEILQRQG